MTLFDVGQDGTENVALISLSQRERYVTPGRDVTFTAQVKNFGPTDRSSHAVRFVVDDRPVDEQVIDVAAGDEASVADLGAEFDVVYDPALVDTAFQVYWEQRNTVQLFEDVPGTMEALRGRYVLGDRVLAINGTDVHTVDQLRDAFENIGVGGTAELTVDRDGRKRRVKIELQRVG